MALKLENNLGNKFSLAHASNASEISLTSKDLASTKLVDSIAELRLISGSTADKLEVLGYYEKGDRGGGLFYWDSTSTEADNGGTIIQATGVITGRWKRVYSGAINVKWFGARGDGVTDDTLAINNAISLYKNIYIPTSVYVVSNLVVENIDGFTIFGEGELFLKNNSNTPIIKLVNCTNFIIDGLVFNGNKANQTYSGKRNSHSGISIIGNATTRYAVVNNRIHNNLAGAGILTITGGSNKSYGYIARNKIYNVGMDDKMSDAIFCNSGWSSIENNEIDGATDYGIAGDYSEKLSISGNKIYNTLVGIGVLGANFWNVADNIIDTSGLGIAVSLSGNSAVEPYLSYDVILQNNIITNITRAVSGTPNGDAISIDPSASRISLTGNKINTAFRGIGASALNVICTSNEIYNTTDRGIHCTGAGSIIANNKIINTAGNYYGSMTNKTIIDRGVENKVDISTFYGGWKNYGSPFENAGYYKNDGRVYLYGVVKGGTLSIGQPFINLPVGYRPLCPCVFTVQNSYDNIPTIIKIDTSGNVIYISGGGTEVHLNQVSFVAQQ